VETKVQLWLGIRKIALQLKVSITRSSHLLPTLSKLVGCLIPRANQQQSRQPLLRKHFLLNLKRGEQQKETMSKY
jgi:hypothetical protein